MEKTMFETAKWVAETFGLPGLILSCWMWDSWRKDKMINDALIRYHNISEATLKSLTKIKTILQLKLTKSLDDLDEEE